MALSEVQSVAMVEDNLAVCEAVSAIIDASSEFRLAWMAHDLASARRKLLLGADVLMLDLGLPDGRGVDLLPQLRKLAKPPVVVVFTLLGDEASVVEAISEGVDGYVLKNADPSSLLDTLRLAAAGESPISPAVAGYLLRRLRQSERAPAPVNRLMALTARERDVLEALARGLSYRDVATRLGMKPNTVAHHVRNLYPKLAATSRSEAVFRAVQDGILSFKS
ncbi:MAG: response regulator transcription factor [Lysobacterales bacterium]|nr:response regulator transcription factor [Xanthomonadales bacterium]MCP5476336.1 response regulator transcription factor [Rhodanobacteraceae bacterium]